MSRSSGESDIPRYRVNRLQNRNTNHIKSKNGDEDDTLDWRNTTTNKYKDNTGNIRPLDRNKNSNQIKRNSIANQGQSSDAPSQNHYSDLQRQKPQYRKGRYGNSSFNGDAQVKPTLDPEEQEKMRKRNERFAKEAEQQKRDRDTQYGFVSRGEDSRLQQSEKSRHDFFNQILLSFVKYCSENTASSLHHDLSKFIDRDEKLAISKTTKLPDSDDSSLRTKSTINNASPSSVSSKGSMDPILLSLRKLREAMIKSRADNFAKKVFLFSIRISANIGHYQTYIPSINYLLNPTNIALLNQLEKEEIVTLLILHITHFNQHYNKAIRLFFKYLEPDAHSKVFKIIQSFINRDYHQWIQIYNAEVDNAVFNTMKFGLDTIIESMVQCITESYFKLSLKELEGTMLPSGITFDIVTKQYGAQWTKDNNDVKIRERSAVRQKSIHK